MKVWDFQTRILAPIIIYFASIPNHFSELGSLIPDKEFIFKVKNLGELKQRLRRNLKLEEPNGYGGKYFHLEKKSASDGTRKNIHLFGFSPLQQKL